MAAAAQQQERVVGLPCRSRRGLAPDCDLAERPRGGRAARVEELAPRDGDEPPLRVVGGVAVPAPQGLQERVLDGVLGRREVGSAADEDAQHLRGEVPQQVVTDHGYSTVEGTP
nr:hypothetical protein GCM10025732_04460 [Glycomyces mayteni]